MSYPSAGWCSTRDGALPSCSLYLIAPVHDHFELALERALLGHMEDELEPIVDALLQ